MKRRTQRTGLVSRRVTKREMRDAIADMLLSSYLVLARILVPSFLAILLITDQVFGISFLSGRGLVILALLWLGALNPLLLGILAEAGSRMRRRKRTTLILITSLLWITTAAFLVAGELAWASKPSLDIDPLDPLALAKLDAVRDSFAMTGRLHSIAFWLAMSLALLFLVLITPRLLQARRDR